MKTFRTVILIGLVLAVFTVLAFKNSREKAVETSSGESYAVTAPGVSRAEQVLADAKEAGQPVWLLLHSSSCVPCIELEGVYKKLEPEYKGKVTFLRVNVDDQSEKSLIMKSQVRMIPKSVYYDKNGEVTGSELGAFTPDEMRAKLNKLLE